MSISTDHWRWQINGLGGLASMMRRLCDEGPEKMTVEQRKKFGKFIKELQDILAAQSEKSESKPTRQVRTAE